MTIRSPIRAQIGFVAPAPLPLPITPIVAVLAVAALLPLAVLIA